jgi:phenylalanyl-tRNA synthetase beta chain
MNISYNWLKQFVEIDWKSEDISALLTDLGLEVEGIRKFESVPGSLQGVVVGEILKCEKHKNADKLQVCEVAIGGPEPVSIVCGAPNVAKGQKVAVAAVGTTLYDTEGNPWKIKKGKIRGTVSEGMICAEDELGLGESHEGILVLETDASNGTPLETLFPIENDEIFEIGLTPNRADAMSHYGVARDLRAGLRQREVFLEVRTPSVSTFNIDNRSLRIDVSVEDYDMVPRYGGISLTNLIVQPSPHWLQNRLKAIGLKPINNVVDATNYVLHELGQPLHAFDADRIFGKKVVVKKARAGSKFMTLDGIEHILDGEDLMICDGEKPMCIAGIFGGINTGVTEDTKSIFLESAYFDPVSIRKTAKRHGLNTDASFRFERGVDINNVEYALVRAAILIRELTGGTISSDIVDLYPKKKENHNVFLRFEKIDTLIGHVIPRDMIKSILASLDIQVRSVTETGLGLSIPFYRVDVQREVDVIEEVLRVYGYNNVAFSEKLNASIAPPPSLEPHALEEAIGRQLTHNGFYEILANSLTNPSYNKFTGSDSKLGVTLMNPLSRELSAMRSDMLFGGLEVIAHNLNRKQPDLKFFEFGKIYRREEGKYQEDSKVSLLLCGNSFRDHWTRPEETMGFFYLKGVIYQLLERVGFQSLRESPASGDARFSEGLQLSDNGTVVATFGVVKPEILKAFDISQPVLYADLVWSSLMERAGKTICSYRDIPKFPEVKRDFALLLDEQVTYQQLYDLSFKAERSLLQEIQLFDVYKGDKLPEGKKSYAVSFTLLNPEKTLTDKQIDAAMKRLQIHFEKELGAELR